LPIFVTRGSVMDNEFARSTMKYVLLAALYILIVVLDLPVACSLSSTTLAKFPDEKVITSSNRRSFLQNAIVLITSTTTCLPFEAHADEQLSTSPIISGREGKPFAPLEALLPATRCKIWIDHAYEVGSGLSSTNDDKNNKNAHYKVLAELNSILSNRPTLFLPNEKALPRAGSRMTAQITTSMSKANKQDNQRNRVDLSFPNQLAAILNQADVERQWGMLQSDEAQRERGDGIRAALNFYTRRLQFGDSYVLTASKEDTKRMIRNDELPALTAVITADLDLRDLYRNQLLTLVEDWQAEVAYQSKLTVEEVDFTDVIDLMDRSHTACNKWFDLIAPGDVQQALEVVRNE